MNFLFCTHLSQEHTYSALLPAVTNIDNINLWLQKTINVSYFHIPVPENFIQVLLQYVVRAEPFLHFRQAIIIIRCFTISQ